MKEINKFIVVIQFILLAMVLFSLGVLYFRNIGNEAISDTNLILLQIDIIRAGFSAVSLMLIIILLELIKKRFSKLWLNNTNKLLLHKKGRYSRPFPSVFDNPKK